MLGVQAKDYRRHTMNTDLPKGYRWAREHEMDRADAIVVARSVSSNGHIYTQGESDIAVPKGK
jgi:hypothetical protein